MLASLLCLPCRRGFSAEVATFALQPAAPPGAGPCDGQADVVLELRALEGIEAGAELVHCYVDIAWPVWARQQRLSQGYAFVCHCARCEGPREQDLQLCGTPRGGHILGDGAARLLGGPPADGATRAAVAEVRKGYMHREGLVMAAPDKARDLDLVQSASKEEEASEASPSHAVELWRASLDLRARHAHRLHLSLAHARHRAADVAARAGAWDLAADCLEGICNLRREVLPRLHPQLAAALARAGSAQRRAAAAGRGTAVARRRALAAVAALREARGALEALYGQDAQTLSFVRDVCLDLGSAEAEAAALGCTLPPVPQSSVPQGLAATSAAPLGPRSAARRPSRGPQEGLGVEPPLAPGALNELD